ncbi:hypothetical protein ACROYT_G038436 [Oculina patagonica]
MNVHCYVSQSDELDREDARHHGVNLITAESIPGSTDRLDCLKIPPPLPHLDIVVGHGRKFGVPAHFIRKQTGCMWIQFVHVFCEDLGKYKKSEQLTQDTIDENEKKHRLEKELCKEADKVVGVGPRLQSKYRNCLRHINIQVLTPGIFDSFSNQSVRHFPELSSVDEHEFSVFLFGRVTFEDLYVKGYDIIGKAIASLGESFKLTVVGSPPGEQRKIEKWFLKKTQITREQLTIRRYCDQEELKGMFREADVVALPSRAEGFGLVALEAISAGVPVLISKHSGISTALQEVEGGASVIVANQDPEEWARRLQQLSQQLPKDRSDNAIRFRENYRKAYPWKTECGRFKLMIEVLLEGSNKENIKRLSQKVQNSDERVTHRKGKRSLLAPKQTEDLPSKRRRLESNDDAATTLQSNVWWHLGQLFGFRRIESQRLKWGDITLEKDSTKGNERLVLKSESSPKPRQVFQPVAKTSTDTYQCPVNLYKEFWSHRPEDMNKPDSPFYLSVNLRRKPTNTVWYMKRPLAFKKIGK